MPGFDAIDRLDGHKIVNLSRLPDQGDIAALPVWRRIMLELLIRNLGMVGVTEDHLRDALRPCGPTPSATLFMPMRVIMQDYSGTAVIVDLAALRSALAAEGLDPDRAVPRIPVDLVIDHSLILAHTGPGALARNLEAELADNAERYAFLKWAEKTVPELTVVPPGQGIIHQLNMERFAQPVCHRDGWLMPDTVLGTDSHTTMINGLGILGWGVGGIEATAAMMGQPMEMPMPRSVGLWLSGEKRAGVQASDIALTLAERLRSVDVVDCIIEVQGPGVATLGVEDRATIANMCPEYGATACLFPMDEAALAYLARQGRPSDQISLARRYLRQNGLMANADETTRFDDRLDFDLSRCGVSAAGPSRPDQRCDLTRLGTVFRTSFPDASASIGDLSDGDLVLAAIASCTNTANSEAMIAAGLVARSARRLNLAVPRRTKCTMTLGSTAAAEDLRSLGLLEDLEAVGFYVDGYGCGACVGNSGDLEPEVEALLEKQNFTVAAILSGNRNFPGRIHHRIKANFLTSPAAVVALSLVGHIRGNLDTDPIAQDPSGRAIYLADLWPGPAEIAAESAALPKVRSTLETSRGRWDSVPTPQGATFPWDSDSSYLIQPPFFDLPAPAENELVLEGAMPLLFLGDAITTDHISPVGPIGASSDAGRYLSAIGVAPHAFNSYGARRGNHEVMLRGTFSNPRLENRLSTRTGPWTRIADCEEDLSVVEAAEIHRAAGRQQVVIAGKAYGAGSARDWAAKGTRLLGIRAVIAEGFERIHRANLVCAGVLPIQVTSAMDFPVRPDLALTLAVSWKELVPGARVLLNYRCSDGSAGVIEALLRLDTEQDVAILCQGGLLPSIKRCLVDA
ncbi:MAG: aconitate hydratase AcnA [Haliea sp.]